MHIEFTSHHELLQYALHALTGLSLDIDEPVENHSKDQGETCEVRSMKQGCRKDI